jgi:hypothetical protein
MGIPNAVQGRECNLDSLNLRTRERILLIKLRDAQHLPWVKMRYDFMIAEDL